MLIGPLHWKLLFELGIRDHPTVTDALDQDETDIFNLMQDVLKSRYSRELVLKLAPNDAERFMVLLQSVSLNYVSCVPEAYRCNLKDVGQEYNVDSQ